MMRHGGPGGPRRMMMAEGDKVQDFRGTMLKLVGYLHAYRGRIVVVFVFAIASTVFTIIGPKVLGEATTILFRGVMDEISGTGTIDFASIGQILRNILILYLAAGAFGYVMGWIMAGVSADISYRLRRDIADKIHKLPLKYYDKTTHGEVMSRITNDVDTVNQTLSQSSTQIVTSVVTVIGVLVMMISINWAMTLVSLLVLPLSGIFVATVVRRSQVYYKQQQNYVGHVNGQVEEIFGGHRVVKAFNGEKQSIDKFEGLNDTLFSVAWKSQFLSGLMMPIMNFIGNIGYVAVVIMGGWLTVRNAITVGDIQAFIQYVRSFNRPLAQLANISNILQQTVAAAERVFDFLEEPEEVEEAADPVKLESLEGRVEFRHVRFGYDPEKPVIHDLSAVVEPGQKIAIVGPTGAGKTTLVKLLMRFYDVDSGAILVDGHDIREFSRHDLRSWFGMVLQDTWLYNASIMDNIRYGRQDASDEEVVAAARSAHIDHFVHTIPDGYQTMINEELTNISQGQMQLLTIARAVLADPRILILDEATSSVDTRTEVLIQEAMDKLMVGRTSFIIAHRLSTIRNADLILVIHEGDIVEQGSHEDLLAKGGFYADLYNSQFEYAQAEEIGQAAD